MSINISGRKFRLPPSVRASMRTGDVFILHSGSLLCTVAHALTGALYSHVGLIVVPGTDNDVPCTCSASRSLQQTWAPPHCWSCMLRRHAGVPLFLESVTMTNHDTRDLLRNRFDTDGVRLVVLDDMLFHGGAYNRAVVRSLCVKEHEIPQTRTASMTGRRLDAAEQRNFETHLFCRILPNLLHKKYERKAFELYRAWNDWGPQWLSANWGDEEYLFCSELVAHVYRKIGALRTELPCDEFTPDDFFTTDWLSDRFFFGKTIKFS